MSQLLSKKRLLNHSPEILIRGCQQNDLQSQQQLYKLCYPEMIRICYRYANDADGAGTIYNDAMLKIFSRIEQYNDQGKLLAWIRTIMIRCSIDYCRQQHSFKPLPVQEMEEQYTIDPEVLNRVSGKEIQQLIKQLPGATATVFNLFIYDGFTHKQIATLLNISEGTSKWHVSEAKKLLKLKLERITETELKTNAAG